MKFYVALMGVLGLSVAIAASPCYARGMIIDMSTCSSSLPQASKHWIELPGTGKKGNRIHSGLNFPVLSCTPSATFSAIAPNFEPANSLLYTWVDLAVAGDTLNDVLADTAEGLSSFSTTAGAPDSTMTFVAEVAVLKLTGPYEGGYEIMFNYQTNFLQLSDESSGASLVVSACDNVTRPISPSFVWFDKTYVFTGAGGVRACDANSTNDFVFGPDGTLLGYNSGQSGSFSLTAGLPPGWVIK